MYYKIFNIPVMKQLFRAAKAIPIAGRNEDKALLDRAFDEIDAALAAGEVVCIFPEGELSRSGQLLRLKKGFELIARQSGAHAAVTFDSSLSTVEQVAATARASDDLARRISMRTVLMASSKQASV